MKPISASGTRRVVRFALEFARRHGRKRVTVGHKANIMKFSDGVFLATALEMDRDEYSDVELDEMQIDELAMWLAWEPEDLDVLLLPNLYGDILSDLCAGLVGGLGVVPGANLGEEIAIFEAVHGSAPDIAGRGLANPTALIRSSVLMLEHLGMEAAARRIRTALREVVSERKILTRDVGGEATTEQFTEALVAAIGVGG